MKYIDLSKVIEEKNKELDQKLDKSPSGGIWSLSGYEFQIRHYFYQFFISKNLEVKIEDYSDISISMSNGDLHLIEVKRTLDSSSLKDAVKKAYKDIKQIKEKNQKIPQGLKYEIICGVKKTKRKIDDIKFSDLKLKEEIDNEVWVATIEALKRGGITVDFDPLPALYSYLWNEGIRKHVIFVNKCIEKVLESFRFPEINLPSLHHQLRSLYYEELENRPPNWFSANLVTKEDVFIEQDKIKDSYIVYDRQPRLEDVKFNSFLNRERLFDPLIQDFLEWIRELKSFGENQNIKEKALPIFWISGRSGDGKSVLLLQLLKNIVTEEINIWNILERKTAVFHITDRWRFADFIQQTVESKEKITGTETPPLIFIDDLFNVVNTDEWNEKINASLNSKIPELAIVTCGPSEQITYFEKRIGKNIDIKTHKIKQICENEIEELIIWYEAKTGKKVDRSKITYENPLVVQIMFEIGTEKSLLNFAKNFRKRLEDLELTEIVEEILAMNSLYLDMPLLD